LAQKSNSTMSGKTILITGGTSGLGLVSALELARLGATVIIHGRSKEKCKRTVSDIRAQIPDANLDYLLADLASLAQVKAMANSCLESYQRLDVLINNAGAMFVKRKLSQDGFEMTFAVNHLSHFLLTNLLLQLILDTANFQGEARIINVSSGAHRNAGLDFNDLHFEIGYGTGMKAYGRSKLANLLFSLELEKRLTGTSATVNSLHPGLVATNMASNNSPIIGWASRLIGPVFALSPEQGAQTTIYLASSPEVIGHSGGYYYEQQRIEPNPAALDFTSAQRLWKVSEDMVGIKFPLT